MGELLPFLFSQSMVFGLDKLAAPLAFSDILLYNYDCFFVNGNINFE